MSRTGKHRVGRGEGYVPRERATVWPSLPVPARVPGGCQSLTVDRDGHVPPTGDRPGSGGFLCSRPAFPALVAQRQRHGVQDADGASSNLAEGTHHHRSTRTRARAATGRRTGPRSRGLRVRIPPSARTAHDGPEPYPDGSGGRLQNVWRAVRLRSGPPIGSPLGPRRSGLVRRRRGRLRRTRPWRRGRGRSRGRRSSSPGPWPRR